MQEKAGPNLARSMEIGNEDIQITLDDNDGKNGVAVDLFNSSGGSTKLRSNPPDPSLSSVIIILSSDNRSMPKS
jgi:hypothetical protein